jgi:hypothetical protein
MTEPDDLELVRRLREHYRDTASDAVPSALHAEVREMLSSPVRRRRLPGGPLAAVAAVILVAVLGTVLAVGQRGAAPSSGASAPSSAAVVGAASAAPVGSLPSSTPQPSASQPIVGEMPVLHGSEIFGAVAGSDDASPFLIGGRILYALGDCATPPDFPETPLLRFFGDGLLIGGDDVSFGIPLVTDLEATQLQFAHGAAVLRVHTHDERAADCPPAYRARCQRALVVEQVVWRPTGSAAIPTTMSILPPQVDPVGCSILSFEPARCIAVIERARSIGSIPWPDVAVVRIERMNPRAVPLGSKAIASVLFQRLNGIETRIDVRCKLTDLTSSVCGPTLVQPSLTP